MRPVKSAAPPGGTATMRRMGRCGYASAAAAKAAAKPAAAKPNGDFTVGMRIKYNDGSAWIAGVIESLEPAVVKLEDTTVIRTSLANLKEGAKAGLIVHA